MQTDAKRVFDAAENASGIAQATPMPLSAEWCSCVNSRPVADPRCFDGALGLHLQQVSAPLRKEAHRFRSRRTSTTGSSPGNVMNTKPLLTWLLRWWAAAFAITLVMSAVHAQAQPFAPSSGSPPAADVRERRISSDPDDDDDDDDDEKSEKEEDDGNGFFDRLFNGRQPKAPPAPAPAVVEVMPDASLRVQVPSSQAGTVQAIAPPPVSRTRVTAPVPPLPPPVVPPSESASVPLQAQAEARPSREKTPVASTADRQRREIEGLRREVETLRKRQATDAVPQSPVTNAPAGTAGEASHTLGDDLALRGSSVSHSAAPAPAPGAGSAGRAARVGGASGPAAPAQKNGENRPASRKEAVAAPWTGDGRKNPEQLASKHVVEPALDESLTPVAERIGDSNHVRNPFLPGQVIDVEGLPSGSLTKDPATQKIFRVP